VSRLLRHPVTGDLSLPLPGGLDQRGIGPRVPSRGALPRTWCTSSCATGAGQLWPVDSTCASDSLSGRGPVACAPAAGSACMGPAWSLAMWGCYLGPRSQAQRQRQWPEPAEVPVAPGQGRWPIREVPAGGLPVAWPGLTCREPKQAKLGPPGSTGPGSPAMLLFPAVHTADTRELLTTEVLVTRTSKRVHHLSHSAL
jgi:hypothetical protein